MTEEEIIRTAYENAYGRACEPEVLEGLKRFGKEYILLTAIEIIHIQPTLPVHTMTLTEIKKALYKERPEAKFLHARKSNLGVFLVYGCTIGADGSTPNLFFEIPATELGDGLFLNTMAAQLLIRYIIQPETFQS